MSIEQTHVATKENKVVSKVDDIKATLNSDYLKTVTNYYGGNKEEAIRFMTAAVDYIRRVPKLLEVNKMSLMTALVQSAQFRFMPSGVAGEAYIIPYGEEAKFQLGYQGIVTLLYRTDKIKGISANIVYEKDDFKYEEGLNPILYHKPVQFGTARGEAIGVYTVAQMEGGARTFKVMDKDAIMGIKELSKAKSSKESPWNSDKDPELWMWKKTCLIQHAKLLPKTQDLQRAIEADYAGSGLQKPQLDAAGPAVARALHEPIAPAPAAKEPTEAEKEKIRLAELKETGGK